MRLVRSDPTYQAMRPSSRRLMRVLIAFHDPATGKTRLERTKNQTLMDRCECSESTLKRARREAIETGWIAGYDPGDGGRGIGDGGWAGRHVISRTPDEAAEARLLRQAPDAPYWPAIPDREPLAPPTRTPRRQPAAASPAQPAAGTRRDVAHAAQQSVQDALTVDLEAPLPDLDAPITEYQSARAALARLNGRAS